MMAIIGPAIQLIVLILGFLINNENITDAQKKSYYDFVSAMGMRSLVPTKLKQDLEKIFEDLEKE